MVVSKVEFQAALAEINESFAKLYDRVTALEAEKEAKPKTRSTTKKAEVEADE